MPITFGVTGPSGIDLNSLVDGLVGIEQNKVIRVENQKSGYQVKFDAYNKVRSLLFDIKSKSDALSKSTAFDLFKATSSNADAVTVSGASGSTDGKYGVSVFQTASSEKMISANGKITSLTTTLASQGIALGDISVGGAKITVDDNDTLNDLRAKINAATDEKGNKIGVSASVMKMADNNYRLILAAKESGAAGVEYKDLTSTTLQDLGIIKNAGGDKGIVAQTLTSSTDITAAWNALADGEAITFGGTDHDGNAVSGSFVKMAGKTVDDFYAEIRTMYHNAVTVTADGTGALSITDAIGGSSKLALSSLVMGGTSHTVTTTTMGQTGSGVLTAGKDAYFSIEGMSMTSASNTVSSVIAGTTFTLGEATEGKTVTVGLTRDIDGITAKFKALLESYNTMSAFAKNAVKLADPNDKEAKSGELAGDMTLTSIVGRIRDAFRSRFDLAGGGYTSLTMIGVKSDPSSGDLSLDEAKFKKAIETNLADVEKLFVTTSSSDNPQIALGRSTEKTKPGRYVVEESGPEHLRIRRSNSTEWYTSMARSGEVVIFDKGPAEGLALTAPAGSISASSTFTLSKGFTVTLSETLAELVDSRSGAVATRQTALQQSLKRADERISDLTDRVESYRSRLIKQFSGMESALSGLQQQGSSITRAFG